MLLLVERAGASTSQLPYAKLGWHIGAAPRAHAGHFVQYHPGILYKQSSQNRADEAVIFALERQGPSSLLGTDW